MTANLTLQDFYPIAAIATTPGAVQTLLPLTQGSGITLWLPESLGNGQFADAGSIVYSGSLKQHIATLWPNHRAFVFCLAAGAVVRLIAPLLDDKATDPAVVVIDREGKFVISLCSGHQGGSDRLSQLIARQLGATPILTGAAAGLGLPGLDVLGLPFGWRKGGGNWTEVSAAIARGESVRAIQEAGSPLWQQSLPSHHPFIFEQDLGKQAQNHYQLSITPYQRPVKSNSVQWHPRVLWIGMGCERGTSRELMEIAIARVFQQFHLAQDAIAGIATLDRKADEEGILELCRLKDWPLKTFPPEALGAIAVPTPSAVVEREVGTPSVAEASAILASQGSPAGKSLVVPKQIFSSKNLNEVGTGFSHPLQGAVTLAIAQSPLEYTGRTGQLLLVGTGPGSLEQMTPAAQTALCSADAVIGYSLYLDLIQPLHRPGQIIEAFPITQETQRARRAIELAKWGLSVAVVSSGDCGIYGMAGLVFEKLQKVRWDGKTPQVQVFPGISALQAAASRVGAPLMHDFCAISLSDLLTPWEAIAKRLEAAAMGDFVTALYNPRSQKRTQPIIAAQTIFLQHRNSNTPVAIVRSAYRPDEQIFRTTLKEMLHFPIDMLTTLIIGNSSTRTHADWIVTPRGYS